MFFFRRESKLQKTAARRLKSPRGSAYLEFALVLPIVVMVVSAMVEFTAFWDAKIMANHAAWTCGRIATVRAGEREAAKSSTSLIGKKPSSVADLLNPDTQIDGMYVATTLLMSTCSMGSMHGSAADLAKDWVEKWIGQGMSALRTFIETQIKTHLTELVKGLADLFPFDIGDNVIGKAVTEIMNKIIENVTKPIAEALAKLVESMLPDAIFSDFESFLNNNRALRQIVYAADRVATYDVIAVKERDDASIPAFSRVSLYGGGPLDLPATYDTKSTYDEWMVKTYSGWPPNNQSQKMIDVTIKWPFERAWMFPVLASAKSASAPGDVPTAVGRALFYPQPNIKNANLYSEGAEAFDPGTTNSYVKAIEDLKKAYNGFLNIALLSYRYRLQEETVGPYDSSSSSGSYKGIGRGVSGETTKEAYYALDGLVLWMERAPDDTSSHSAWQSKSAPSDYKKCFTELVETDDETCKFWYGVPFAAIRTAALDRLECRRYADKEWFFWGDDTHRHLRVKHNAPGDLFASWKGSFGGQPPWHALLNGGKIDGAPSEVSGTFTPGSLVMNVSEGDFGSAVSKYAGGSAASYGDWRRFAEEASAFAANANAMIAFSVPTADDLKAREQGVLTNVFATAYKHQDDIRAIEREGRDEIAAALGDGSGGEADYSSMGFFDFGDDDEDIIKDPEKAVEKMKEKLETLKKTVVNDVIAIDEAEQAARDAYPKLAAQLVTTSNSRREKIKEWAAKTAAALLRAGQADADAVAQVMRESFPMSGDLTSDTAALETAATSYVSALKDLYDAEVQLAKDLGLKSGKIRPDEKGEVDPSGDPVPEDDPYRPSESGSESGSDDDGAGDFWKRKSGGRGWERDPSKKEDI